jgi:hypothetical protein
MYMKGIRRLGLKIAERGSIVELHGLSNLSHRNVAEIEREFINAV